MLLRLSCLTGGGLAWPWATKMAKWMFCSWARYSNRRTPPRRIWLLTRLGSAPVPFTVFEHGQQPGQWRCTGRLRSEGSWRHDINVGRISNHSRWFEAAPSVGDGNLSNRSRLNAWPANPAVAVIIADFVKINDLSVDVLSPQYFFLLPLQPGDQRQRRYYATGHRHEFRRRQRPSASAQESKDEPVSGSAAERFRLMRLSLLQRITGDLPELKKRRKVSNSSSFSKFCPSWCRSCARLIQPKGPNYTALWPRRYANSISNVMPHSELPDDALHFRLPLVHSSPPQVEWEQTEPFTTTQQLRLSTALDRRFGGRQSFVGCWSRVTLPCALPGHLVGLEGHRPRSNRPLLLDGLFKHPMFRLRLTDECSLSIFSAISPSKPLDGKARCLVRWPMATCCCHCAMQCCFGSPLTSLLRKRHGRIVLAFWRKNTRDRPTTRKLTGWLPLWYNAVDWIYFSSAWAASETFKRKPVHFLAYPVQRRRIRAEFTSMFIAALGIPDNILELVDPGERNWEPLRQKMGRDMDVA